jgi:tRNA threonylcarbamoyladenosine biosynthesis protein TsaE
VIFISNSEAETEAFAAGLAKDAAEGSVYCLEGELGAGKTAFARGFARGLGYDGAVTSPTFCILNVYEGGRLPLYHFDAYRVGPADMEDVGFDEYLSGDGACLVEWAGNVSKLIPAGAVWVRIMKTGEDSREVLFDY